MTETDAQSDSCIYNYDLLLKFVYFTLFVIDEELRRR